jgi:uncharacterized membrane protein YeaQ/YmgE (transglycosylase-associated protein family)
LLRYLWMFIVGIVVGVIAKLIYPGAAHMGIIMSVIGALIVLFIYDKVVA